MPIRRLADIGVFKPEEVSLLRDIFDQICAQGGIDRKSAEAEEVATNLIAYHQRGLRGDELFHAATPNKAKDNQ